MTHPRRAPGTVLLAMTLAALAACSDTGPTPVAPEDGLPAPLLALSSDGGFATVPLPFGGDLVFWPWTASDPVAPAMPFAKDPMNLIFVGPGADPRAIRAGLMSLELGRASPLGSGPLACTWTDAIGSSQAGYGEPGGWAGAAIQLQCGDYAPLRFHLRLFDMGEYTLGAAHWDFLIPNTTDHQVISWETAEQALLADLLFPAVAGGLEWTPLTPPPGVPINDTGAGWWRVIPQQIWNAMAAVPELAPILAATGAIADADGFGNHGIAHDGNAMVILVPEGSYGDPGVIKRDLTILFDQTIPKPFCGNPQTDFLHVYGPVDFKQHVVVTPSGNFMSTFHAKGHLELTPLPDGKTYKALVNEKVKGRITDNGTMTSTFTMRFEMPQTGPDRGKLFIRVTVDGDGEVSYSLELRC